MTDEKRKPTPATGKTSSAGSQAEQGLNKQQVIELLTEILQKTKDQIEPKIPEAVAQAIKQFEEIDFALRVPTQTQRDMKEPKWELPLLNPRTIRPGEREIDTSSS